MSTACVALTKSSAVTTKLFDKATIDRQAVLENPSSLPKSTLLVDQDVTYYRKPDSPFKTVNSLLTIEFNGEGKVVKHTEEVHFYPMPRPTHGSIAHYLFHV